MKNELQQQLEDCSNELNEIDMKIRDLAPLDKTKSYLTNYALIRTCGTIEYVYRSIVADYFNQFPIPQMHTYIENTIRNGSMSATYDNMCSLLGKFDVEWNKTFKNSVKCRPDSTKLQDSLKSLVNNRHLFAHGKNPMATFQEIRNYYNDALIILGIFDSTVT